MLRNIAFFIFVPVLMFLGLRDRIQAPAKPVPSSPIAEESLEYPEEDTPVEIASNSEDVVKNEIEETQSLTEKEVEVETKEIVVAKSEEIVEVPTQTETPSVFIPNFDEINTFARQATVNILCETDGHELSPISGTGVVVDPRGLILTNAHIAQYFLLKDFRRTDFVECKIRTGSPAYPTYKVELVYISPEWVSQNKDLITQTAPKGTGERDFAFLRITGRIDGSAISSIPYVPINVREYIGVSEKMLLSSYPAGFLGGISILQDLNITTAIADVAEVFTFGDNKIDLISIPGTVVSQKGSSGGAVVDVNKTLVGIISTSSDGSTTSERNLYAITGAYISRSLEAEIGINLYQFLNQDLEQFAKVFNETNAPSLTKLITDELTKSN